MTERQGLPLINFRTSDDNKLLAEVLARRRGFNNVSELMNALLVGAINAEWGKDELEALLNMLAPPNTGAPKKEARGKRAA